MTQITIQFTLSRDIDAAAQDVQAAITKAAPLLPPGMPTPPSYQKVNPADQPVLYLALSSPTLPFYTVDEYAQTNLAQRISTISGVAQVIVFGSQKYAVRVQVDPRALAARGIGIDEVEQAIARANVNKPTGTLYGPHQAINVQSTGQLTDAAAYRPLIVAYRNGSPVRLEELGRVIDGVQTDKVASWFNNDRAVVLAIQRQPGTNTIEVVDAVRKLLPTFRAAAAGRGEPGRRLRPLGGHPRVGPRRAVHAAAHHRPGGAGDLPVPAQSSRPRSSRAWRCRCRSSAPSRSCTCSATRSTSSR